MMIYWHIYLGMIETNSMQEFMLNYASSHATTWNHTPHTDDVRIFW